MAITQVSTSVLKDGAVTSAKLDTNIAITGDLTVDTNTLFVDSTNNRVGIGTDIPTNDLHISTVTGSARFTSTGGGSNLFMESATGNITRIRWNSDSNFSIRNDATSTDVLNITQASNVGIGTAGPASKLHIIGNASIGTTGAASSSGLLVGGKGGFGNYVGSGDFGAAYNISLVAGITAKGINMGYNATADAGFIGVVHNGTGWKNLLLQPIAGNVGIGTVSPDRNLHIQGSSAIAKIESTSNSQNSQLDLKSTTTTWSIGQNQALSNTGTLEFYNGSSKFVVDTSGNVGIGVPIPSAKLDVNGTGRFKNSSTAIGLIIDRGLDVNIFGDLGVGMQMGALDGTTFKEGATIYGGLKSNGDDGTFTVQVREANVMSTRMQITSAGNIQIGAASNFYLAKYSDSQLLVQGPYGNIRIGPANSSYAHFATDRSTFYFGNNIQIGGGIYDYQDTNYYLDPATTSDLNAVKTNSLYLDRQEATSRGISWYSPSYNAWSEYMSPSGTSGCGPTANITAPSGAIVTSWAQRTFIENASNYGWTWESGLYTGQPSGCR